MIYRKLKVTDQSYEVSSHDKKLFHEVKLPCSEGKSANETVCCGGVSYSRLRCCYLFVQILDH